MTVLSKYLSRLKRAPKYYGKGLYQQLMHKDIFLWAQAIAFKVLITIVPVLILATGVLGQVLRRDKPMETVATFLQEFLPLYRTEQLLGFLRELSTAGNTLTIVGAAGLLFSAIILFTTLRVAVGNVFQEEWHDDRTIVGGYLFDIRMVAQVGLFFILTLGVTLLMQWLNVAGFEFIEKIGLDYLWIKQGWRRAFKFLGLLIPLGLTIAMFFQLIYFVPKPHPPKRSAFTGALTTAFLWEVAKYGFTFYATNVGRFDRYAGDKAEAAIGDTFGLIIAFVFWVYYSGLVLLLGAIVALLHEKAHRSRRLAAQAEAAERAEQEIATNGVSSSVTQESVPREADIAAQSSSDM